MIKGTGGIFEERRFRCLLGGMVDRIHGKHLLHRVVLYSEGFSNPWVSVRFHQNQEGRQWLNFLVPKNFAQHVLKKLPFPYKFSFNHKGIQGVIQKNTEKGFFETLNEICNQHIRSQQRLTKRCCVIT